MFSDPFGGTKVKFNFEEHSAARSSGLLGALHMRLGAISDLIDIPAPDMGTNDLNNGLDDGHLHEPGPHERRTLSVGSSLGRPCSPGGAWVVTKRPDKGSSSASKLGRRSRTSRWLPLYGPGFWERGFSCGASSHPARREARDGDGPHRSASQ